MSSTLSGKLDSFISIPNRMCAGLLIMFIGVLFTLFTPLLLILIGLIILCFGFFFVHEAPTNWVSILAKEAKGSASSLFIFLLGRRELRELSFRVCLGVFWVVCNCGCDDDVTIRWNKNNPWDGYSTKERKIKDDCLRVQYNKKREDWKIHSPFSYLMN
jgi:hypothetical protein